MQKTFLHQKGAANSALLAHTVVKACNCCNASGLRHYCLLPWCSFLSSGPLPPASGAPPARESSTGKSLLSLGAACNNTMQSNVWLYQLNRVGDFYYSYEASRQDIASQWRVGRALSRLLFGDFATLQLFWIDNRKYAKLKRIFHISHYQNLIWEKRVQQG